MVMTGIYCSDFLYQVYTIYIYTVCILFRMRYAKYILKLKNLYIFYTQYILPGLVDVLGIYLRYDNIGDILLQNVTTLVYVQVIGYMRTGREFTRIVWICSFFEFPTRSYVAYNSGIWLIFGSCLQRLWHPPEFKFNLKSQVSGSDGRTTRLVCSTVLRLQLEVTWTVAVRVTRIWCVQRFSGYNLKWLELSQSESPEYGEQSERKNQQCPLSFPLLA